MAIADYNAIKTVGVSTPPAIVRTVRLDPKTMTLKTLFDDAHLSRGQPILNESPVLDYVSRLVTGPSHRGSQDFIGHVIERYRTAASISRPVWPKIPTIADYADMDAIHDMDEVEDAFYEATKRLGW